MGIHVVLREKMQKSYSANRLLAGALPNCLHMDEKSKPWDTLNIHLK
jgi:hypothetical protein